MQTYSAVAQVAVMALAVVAMVWPSSSRSIEPDLVGTGWRIIEVAGRSADPAATIAFEQNRVSGSTGCNRFFASLAVQDETVRVGPIATTKIFCGLRTSIERDTLAALSRVATAKRDGAGVTLLDAAGKPVVLLGR